MKQFKSKHKQGGWLQLAGAALGAYASYASANSTNSANRTISRDQMKFQTKENAIARDFNSAQSIAQRNWASSETRDNRNYNTEMSNTAVQRRMEDMNRAGINPILAGKFDATTPANSVVSGSTASGSPTGSGSSYRAIDEGQSAFQGALKTLELKQIDKSIKNLEAQTKKTSAEAEVTEKSVPTAQAVEQIKQGVINQVESFIKKNATDFPAKVQREINELRNDLKSNINEVEKFFQSGQSMWDDVLNTTHKKYETLKQQRNSK